MLEIYKTNLSKYNMESEMILSDLTDFKIEQEFKTIIMPNGNFCLINRTDIIKVLNNFKTHLSENGRIYLDLIFPTSFKPGTIHEFDFRLDNNEIIKVKNKAISIDWIKQKTYTELEFLYNDKIEMQLFTFWWYGVEEFTNILKELNFKNINHVINFKNLNLKTLTFIFEK